MESLLSETHPTFANGDICKSLELKQESISEPVDQRTSSYSVINLWYCIIDETQNIINNNIKKNWALETEPCPVWPQPERDLLY
ncbi:hypothetical protein TNIN_102411 [Trichonephila inaurata madagascariensis]|uniref:Uncharacterized protein n=1 Tax=Trichonephila inaurata madagascariensis TaxID=2747483 RepID=A0A8X6XFT7_9ARAC|nr:hypothetical protein TNIN_102411 [Trichonephila inaurata madagascariensis]